MLNILGSQYVFGVVTRIGGQITAFTLIIVASWHLDLAEFGTYALAWALVVIANAHMFTGFYHAVLRCHDVQNDADTLFWMILALGFVAMVIIAGIGQAAGGMREPVGQVMMAMSPIPLIFALTAWNEALLVQAARIRAASGHVLASECVGLAVALTAFWAGLGLFSLILSRLVWALSGVLFTSAMVRRCPRPRFDPSVAQAALRTALPIWGSVNVTMFSNYGADLVLAVFLSPAAVGAYRGGARIANTAGDVILQPLTMMSWSRFSRLEARGEQADIRRAWLEYMAIANALVWPFLVSVSLMAPAIVATLFDPEWAAAAAIVAILSLARALLSVGNLLEPTMVCHGRPSVQFQVRLAGAALLLVLLLTLGRISGEGAAVAVLLTNAVVGLVSLLVMMRVLALSRADLLRSFAPGAALTIIAVLCIEALAPLRADMTVAAGLGLTVAIAAVIWAALFGLCLARRVLVVPSVQ